MVEGLKDGLDAGVMEGEGVNALMDELSADPIAVRSFITLIARTCHAWVREYQLGTEPDSTPHWELAPDYQRKSTLESIENILAQYYDPSKPPPTPRMVHELWARQKMEDVWRWGSQKAPAVAGDRDMVDWPSLPREQRVKDEVFLAIVLTMVPRPSFR